jgi:hypothetical protein
MLTMFNSHDFQHQELKRVLIEARLAGAPMELIDRGTGERGMLIDL